MDAAQRARHTVESARAALALGPVAYRCNVCGETHVADGLYPQACVHERLRRALRPTGAPREFDGVGRAFVQLIMAIDVEAYGKRPPIGYWVTAGNAYAQELVDMLRVPECAVFVATGRTTRPVPTAARDGCVCLARSIARRGGDLTWMLMAEPRDADREIVRETARHMSDESRLFDCGPTRMKHLRDLVRICGGDVAQAYRELQAELGRLAAKEGR